MEVLDESEVEAVDGAGTVEDAGVPVGLDVVDTRGLVDEWFSDAVAELDRFGAPEVAGGVEGVKVPGDVSSPEEMVFPEDPEGIGEIVSVRMAEADGVPEATAELDLVSIPDVSEDIELIRELE